MRRRFPYKKAIIAVALVAASVVLLNTTGKPESGSSVWESLFAKMAKPLYIAWTYVREQAERFSLVLADKQELLRRNEELEKELESVESLKARLAEVESENARLRELLAFQEASPGKYHVAAVCGRNPSKWFSTVTISLGTAEGIQVDDPVVSRAGLVGRVLSVSDHSSTVLLLTDPESGVGATVEGSRDYGVVLGGNGPSTLVLRLFSKEASVNPGDKVVTSGIGSKFPPGILIGEVVTVYVPKPGLTKEAVVRPASDLYHLEEVMVVKR